MSNTLNLLDFKPSSTYACFFKNIPIEKYTPETRELIRKVVGRSVYFKFRGPRYRKDHCLKQDAVKFDVYPRNYY
jgi:hypothetical protein